MNEKNYRVTARATVDLEIDLQAVDKDQAEEKAFSWSECPDGECRLFLFDDNWTEDKELSFWQVMNSEIDEVISVEELESE